MNIVQAYTKFNNQHIILISGFSGSKKTSYAKFISDLFGFQTVSLSQFHLPLDAYAQDKNYVEHKDGTKVLNWDNIYESIDWKKFNQYIDSHKQYGLVVYGFGFPSKLLDFTPNFHIHIKISKRNLLNNRIAFLKKRLPDVDESKMEVDRVILNNVTYPMYMKVNQDSKIDKYINTNEVDDEHIKDEIFNYLISMIQKWLNDNATLIANMKKNNKLGSNENGTSYNKAHSSGPHYEDPKGLYDQVYNPTKKRILYDFNDEGDEYPEEYRKQFEKESESSSSVSDGVVVPQRKSKHIKNKPLKIRHMSSSTDDSEPTYLFTSRDD
jgi:hypothetical protein